MDVFFSNLNKKRLAHIKFVLDHALMIILRKGENKIRTSIPLTTTFALQKLLLYLDIYKLSEFYIFM